MNYYVIGTMGKGKTLLASLLALIYSKIHPECPIYSNFNLKLSNFIYTPLMCLPYSELINLKGALLLIDDIASLSNKERFIVIMASMSRKVGLNIVITAQYYTMLNKAGRELCQYEVYPNYENGVLECQFIDLDDNEFTIKFHGIEKVFELYDTNEIVMLTNKRKVIDEIMKNSNDIDDFEQNLSMFFSTTEYNQIYKEYSSRFL